MENICGIDNCLASSPANPDIKVFKFKVLRVGELHFQPLSLVRKAAQLPDGLLGALGRLILCQ